MLAERRWYLHLLCDDQIFKDLPKCESKLTQVWGSAEFLRGQCIALLTRLLWTDKKQFKWLVIMITITIIVIIITITVAIAIAIAIMATS